MNCNKKHAVARNISTYFFQHVLGVNEISRIASHRIDIWSIGSHYTAAERMEPVFLHSLHNTCVSTTPPTSSQQTITSAPCNTWLWYPRDPWYRLDILQVLLQCANEASSLQHCLTDNVVDATTTITHLHMGRGMWHCSWDKTHPARICGCTTMICAS